MWSDKEHEAKQATKQRLVKIVVSTTVNEKPLLQGYEFDLDTVPLSQVLFFIERTYQALLREHGLGDDALSISRAMR